jgi:hypothetical protein
VASGIITSALDGRQWSGSRSGRFTLGKRDPWYTVEAENLFRPLLETKIRSRDRSATTLSMLLSL